MNYGLVRFGIVCGFLAWAFTWQAAVAWTLIVIYEHDYAQRLKRGLK